MSAASRLDAPSPSIDDSPLAPERRAELAAAGWGYVDRIVDFEIRLRGDGTLTMTETIVRSFLSDSGSNNGGNLTFGVLPSFETARIERAYVAEAGSAPVPLDLETVQITDANEPRLFSDLRYVVIPLPGLRPGSTAIVEFETTFRHDEWPIPWSRSLYLAAPAPTERLGVRVTWDAAAEAPIWATDHPGLACRTAERSVECSARRLPATPSDPDMDAALDGIPRFMVAEKRTWPEVASAVREIVMASLDAGPPFEVPAEIADPSRPEVDKWNALFDFVANDIRYLGLEHHTSAVVPHPPGVTLRRRFGDCKDKVALFLALAERVGLNAHPVLVASGHRKLESTLIPVTNVFDHMIACRQTAGGAIDCVDPTVANVSARDSTLPVAGRMALDLAPGTRTPRRLDEPPFGWRTEVESETKLDCDGSREVRTTRRFDGLAGLRYRADLENVSARERQRALLREFGEATHRMGDLTFEIVDADAPARPLSIRHETRDPASSPLSEATDVADVDTWLTYYGMGIRTENRIQPYAHPGLRLKSTVEYHLCDDVDPDLTGPTLEFESRFGRLERRYARSSSRVVVESVLEIPARVVPGDELADFDRFVLSVLDQTRIWFSLKPRR